MILNTKEKKVYLFEILSLIVVAAFVVFNITLYVSPPVVVQENRDAERRADLETIRDSFQSFLEQDRSVLEEIDYCVDGWTFIGQEDDQLDIIGILELPRDEVLDPEKSASDTGYQICKSLDFSRIMLNAPLSDLRDNTSIGFYISSQNDE